MPRWTFTLSFGLGLGLILAAVDLPLEDPLYRLIMQLRGREAPNPSILIVKMDKPWVEDLRLFLDRLETHSPRAVELDFGLKKDEEARLRPSNRTFPMIWHREESHDPHTEVLPFLSSPSSGSMDLPASRKEMLPKQVIDARLAETIASNQVKQLRKQGPVLMNVAGPPGTYPQEALSDLLDNPKRLTSLAGKVILVAPPPGKAHAHIGDLPFFPRGGSTGIYATEVHANAVDSVLRRRSIQILSPFLSNALTVLVSLLTTAVLFYTVPVLGILGVVFILGVLVLSSVVALSGLFYLDILKPIVAIAVAYYFLIPYRLIIEYKGRWRYQQENKLLSEVETLKDNFMSLVSHNLKTPIARIEGTVETLLSNAVKNTQEIREALKDILRSTDDLNRFISRILNLTRVEHPEYHLRMANRDLNAIVENVIEANQPDAQEKNILIEANLEPLFPVLMDGELIQESVANLIENAVKYTPEGGQVQVSTAESGNWVRVRVADNGPGIPDNEREKIFSKFFRGQQVKNKGIRGSGLGLYLVKYFVELHGGSISARSGPDGGNVFTIDLLRK